MLWDSLTQLPPAPPTFPSIQMNVESQSSHNVGPGFPLSHLLSQVHVDETQHDVYYHPRNLSFLGPLPPSHEQSIQDFNTWNHSPQGLFPSQPLQVPGQPSSLSPPPLITLPRQFHGSANKLPPLTLLQWVAMGLYLAAQMGRQTVRATLPPSMLFADRALLRRGYSISVPNT